MTGISTEVLETAVKPLSVAFLPARGLARSAAKTRIPPMEDGVDCLGHNGRKYNGPLLPRPSQKNVHTLLPNIRQVITDNPQATASGLLTLLNPTRRGWANLHQQAAAQDTCVPLDTAILTALWRWARRRHPQQGSRWGADRSWGRSGHRHGHGCGTAKATDGKTIPHGLCHAAATSVTRDTKVTGACHPYDPAWAIALEARLGVTMEQTRRGRQTLTPLWNEPSGRCPLCTPPSTPVTGGHNHHIVSSTRGGTDRAATRVLIPPHCHRHVHATGLTGSHPRPVPAGPQAQPGAVFQA